MSMSNLYRELILNHWRSPRHALALTAPTHSAELENASCGDSVRVELLIVDGVVRDVAIIVSGCTLATAAGSLLAEQLVGQSIDDVRTITSEQLFTLMGGEPAAGRRRCASLALEALQAISSPASMADRSH